MKNILYIHLNLAFLHVLMMTTAVYAEVSMHAKAGDPKEQDLVLPKSIMLSGSALAYSIEGDIQPTVFYQTESPKLEPRRVVSTLYPPRWDANSEKIVTLSSWGIDKRGGGQVSFDLGQFSLSDLLAHPTTSEPMDKTTGLGNSLKLHPFALASDQVFLELLWTLYFGYFSRNEGGDPGSFHYDIALRESEDLLLVYTMYDRISIWHHPLDSETKLIGPVYKETKWNRVLTTTWNSAGGFQIITANESMLILIDARSNLLELPLPSYSEDAGKPLVETLKDYNSYYRNAEAYLNNDSIGALLGPPDPTFVPRVIEENVVVKGIVKDAESGEVRLLVPDGDTGELKMRSVRKSATAPLSADIEERLDRAKNFLIEIEAKADHADS